MFHSFNLNNIHLNFQQPINMSWKQNTDVSGATTTSFSKNVNLAWKVANNIGPRIHSHCKDQRPAGSILLLSATHIE